MTIKELKKTLSQLEKQGYDTVYFANDKECNRVFDSVILSRGDAMNAVILSPSGKDV